MRTVLPLFALLFFNLSIRAQDVKIVVDDITTYTVIYDFKTGEYVTALLKPKVDRPIVYKVININRLAYNVQVNTADVIVAETDWFTSAADLQKIKELINTTNFSDQVLSEEVPINTQIEIDKNLVQDKVIKEDIEILKKSDTLKLELQQKSKELNKLITNKDKYEYYKSIFGDSASYSGLEVPDINKIDKIKNEINIIKDSIRKIEIFTNEKLDKFQNVRENFNKAYDDFITSSNNINTIIQASQRVLPIASLPFLNKEEYMNTHRKELILTFLELKTIDITSNTVNNQYTNLVLSYNELIDTKVIDNLFDEKLFKKYLNDITLLYENAKKLKLKIEIIDFEKLSQQVQRIIILLEKDETFEYISKPVQPRNDIATFDVNITAKNKDVDVDNSRQFKHSEFVKGGTRIDFSIGLAASYFANTNAYEIYTIEGQNKIGLKSSNVTAPSLVAMISMTNRASRYLAIGGSAGLGIDTNNGKIQLRTIITQSNEIDSVLSDHYKLGLFAALTYNLTKNVRDKISNFKN